MSDDTVAGAWMTLEATAVQRQRMEARVTAWLDARDTSLVSEWLGLFKLQPLWTTGLVAASVASLATAPPMIWLLRTLL